MIKIKMTSESQSDNKFSSIQWSPTHTLSGLLSYTNWLTVDMHVTNLAIITDLYLFVVVLTSRCFEREDRKLH